MTDAISQYSRLGQTDVLARRSADKATKGGNAPAAHGLGLAGDSAASAPGAASTSAAPSAEAFNLANVAAQIKKEPEFDRSKVESIKRAIEDGQYPLNPKRIAESFVAIEQMIGD